MERKMSERKEVYTLRLDRGLLVGFCLLGFTLLAFLSASITRPDLLDARRSTLGGSCPYDLSPANAFLVAGRICPGSDCSNDLDVCHCRVAHSLKTRIKQLLLEGKSPDTIRDEIDRQSEPPPPRQSPKIDPKEDQKEPSPSNPETSPSS